MKITRGALKQLIKEELNEMEDVPESTRPTLEQLDLAYNTLLEAKDTVGAATPVGVLVHKALEHLDSVRADLTGI